MKMMSCIFDEEQEADSTTPSTCAASGQQQTKIDLKGRFIKKKGRSKALSAEVASNSCKVQRSASAIFKSKMYAVVNKMSTTSNCASSKTNNNTVTFRGKKKFQRKMSSACLFFPKFVANILFT